MQACCFVCLSAEHTACPCNHNVAPGSAVQRMVSKAEQSCQLCASLQKAVAGWRCACACTLHKANHLHQRCYVSPSPGPRRQQRKAGSVPDVVYPLTSIRLGPMMAAYICPLLPRALQESLLEVEYVPAVVPPKHKQAAPHDDW